MQEELTTRQNDMRERAWQKYNSWIAAGYVRNESVEDVLGMPNRKHRLHPKSNHLMAKAKPLTSIKFASEYIDDMLGKSYNKCEPPILNKLVSSETVID